MKNIIQMILIITAFLINSGFTQSPSNDFHKTKLSADQNYFTLNDSIKTISFVYNNKAANHAFITGTLWGIGGYLSALIITSSIADNTNCDLSCSVNYAVISMISGAVGLLAGAAYGYLKHYDDRYTIVHYPRSRRKFNHIGISAGVSVPISDNYGVENYSFGISYRTLYSKKYLPNKLSLIFGQNELYYYYRNSQGNMDVWSDEWHIGIKALYMKHEKILSFLYGIETGFYKSNAQTIVSGGYYKDGIDKIFYSPYIDLIVGININLISFLSWDLTYKYEPYGIYNKMKPADSELISHTHKIETSLVWYFK